jgi:hypothetical protein
VIVWTAGASWPRYLSEEDVDRAKFIMHFASFDSGTKVVTDNIPRVDMEEIRRVLLAYFPGGKVVW